MLEGYAAVILVAVGTYLTRFLPMIFGERLRGFDRDLIVHSSTAILSALFVTSFVSFPIEAKKEVTGIVALAFVFATYRKWENLGVSVLTGVMAHLVLSYYLSQV
ncbi:AzlD domain-containing protein [Archaeoglobus neptunius]|uniref:AzlD domain-containing protein n=1 Tax=Archaeoglobus neptunius TaxID=2798580 RepID=UPI0019296AEE|nr:AzlD domain-containing protein [Archaeoglobus neptunius]